MEHHPHDNHHETDDDPFTALPEPERLLEFERTSLRNLALQRCHEALTSKTGLEAGNARLIAYLLASQLPEATALREFWRTGHGDHDQISGELEPLRYTETSIRSVGFFIDQLGTHLYHQEHPGATRAPASHLYPMTAVMDDYRTIFLFATSQELVGADFGVVADRVQSLIDAFGDRMIAWLRLPGVDVLEGIVFDSFEDAYLGTITRPYRTTERWDVVEVNGTVHLFDSGLVADLTPPTGRKEER